MRNRQLRTFRNFLAITKGILVIVLLILTIILKLKAM